MPVPEGQITTSKIWTGEEEVPLPEEPTETEQKEEVRDEDVQLPEEPTEVEEKEEEREPDDLQ